MVRKVAIILAGVIAVKLVSVVLTALWKKVFHEEPPQADEEAPAAKKAGWLAAYGAATGVLRQTARDLVKRG